MTSIFSPTTAFPLVERAHRLSPLLSLRSFRRQLTQFTSGDWTVTGNGGFGPGGDSHAIVDEARGYLYFLSNKDERARHAALPPLASRPNPSRAFPAKTGCTIALIAPDASAFVDTYSNAMTPDAPGSLPHRRHSRRDLINENKVPELADYHLSPVEFVDVPPSDGTKLYASIISPPDFDAAQEISRADRRLRRPARSKIFATIGTARISCGTKMMAQKGYLIFSLDNRGSYFRGHAFETPIYHQFGKIELEDQLAGVKYLKSLPTWTPRASESGDGATAAP